jgi:hypothetical protein
MAFYNRHDVITHAFLKNPNLTKEIVNDPLFQSGLTVSEYTSLRKLEIWINF